MEWLQNNWLWIALGAGFVAMHFFGHGGHGGHSGDGKRDPELETNMPAQEHHDASSPQGSFWTSRAFFVALAFSAIAVLLLLSEHRAHFLGALPLLLLVVACPLLHVFMHGGHGNHTSHSEQSNDKPQNANGDKP